MGGLLALVFALGFYFILLMPLFGGCAVGAVLGWMVHSGQCRNRVVAGMFGVVAGLLMLSRPTPARARPATRADRVGRNGALDLTRYSRRSSRRGLTAAGMSPGFIGFQSALNVPR